MRKKYITSLLLICLFLVSCTKEESGNLKEDITSAEVNISSEEFESGYIRIKVSEELAEELVIQDNGNNIKTNVKSVNDAIYNINIKSIKRTFPYAGKFEDRSRKEGLHLWYDVVFDTSKPLTKAGDDLQKISGVDYVEYRPKVVRIYANTSKVINDVANNTKANNNIFDDPYLYQQWHYKNLGSTITKVAGCDINVYPIWKNYKYGGEDIIVAVVDGGVDFKHEDLNANMWNNPEQTGDWIYGWNFVRNIPLVTADDHGTHVAGTIAAVNNNGKGVSGIAGGNALEGIKGVKIMSCQIFEGDNGGSGASAIKWSADHGAIISQNSWGYKKDVIKEVPASDKAAIDYFIKYAGLDADGNQVAPMKGGIVIFAAGNDNINVSYPSSYDKVLSVSALGDEYKKAYYSNYGPWVNISAPGGDANRGSQVLSTLPDNKYGIMQGTSMACPHVSGVAALVVANRGGLGFTCQDLWNSIVNNVTNINNYESSTGLGVGLVNAYKAVLGESKIAPEKITSLELKNTSNTIEVIVAIPSDEDDYKPIGITIYYDKSLITEENKGKCKYINVSTADLNVGASLTSSIYGLDFNSQYYIAVDSYDYTQNRSVISDNKNIETGTNNPPIITSPMSLENILIKAHQTLDIELNISDPDNNKFDVSLTSGINECELIKQNENKFILRINGRNLSAGKYKTTITAVDEFGFSSSLTIDYQIDINHAPVIVKNIDNAVITYPLGSTYKIKLSDYIKDPDGESLEISVKVSNSNTITARYSKLDGFLHIDLLQYGYSDVELVANDEFGEKVSTSFKVFVANSANEVDLYPNPVVDYLNIRAISDTNAEIVVYNTLGAKVYESVESTNPFSPARVDMRSLSGGQYVVVVKYDNKEIKRNIVKQ